MCNLERIIYGRCGHTAHRPVQYCHSARVDENHQCFSVKLVIRENPLNEFCSDCYRRVIAAQQAASSATQQQR